MDESLYWMELLVEAGIMESKKLESLIKEANELLAILNFSNWNLPAPLDK
jgi:hypothetical protein